MKSFIFHHSSLPFTVLTQNTELSQHHHNSANSSESSPIIIVFNRSEAPQVASNPSSHTVHLLVCSSNLNAASPECHCGHRLSTVCICRLGFSLLHGVLKFKARD